MDIKDIFSAANSDVTGVDGDKVEFRDPPAADAAGADDAAGDDVDGKTDNADDKSAEPAGAAADQGANDEYDVEIITAMHDVISEKFGIKAGVDMKSPEDLLSYIDNVITNLSAPTYASDMSMQFDSFIASGGNPVEFLESIGAGYSIPTLDTQADKENIVRNLLKESGFSDQQISRKIDSYIEHETLDQEAADALDIVKARNAKNVNDKIAQRKAAAEAAEVASKEFVKNVSKYIDDMVDVRGIPVTKEQKAALKQYLLVFNEKDGMTGYQKDFDESVAPIVESAFFTQNRKALIKSAESKGASDAVSKFKSALKTNKIPGKSTQGQGDDNNALAMLLKGFEKTTGRAA